MKHKNLEQNISLLTPAQKEVFLLLHGYGKLERF